MSAAAVAVLEKHERIEARDSYRAAGGSKRRPLKSFLTQAEKREAREAHAARIHAAVDELRDRLGFEAWVEALELNPHISPMNAALVALQSPGEIVGTSASWRKQGYKVRKGERLAGRITGRNFWPTAYFTAAQALATDLEGFEPTGLDAVELDILHAELLRCLDAGEKPRQVLQDIGEGIRELVA